MSNLTGGGDFYNRRDELTKQVDVFGIYDSPERTEDIEFLNPSYRDYPDDIQGLNSDRGELVGYGENNYYEEPVNT
jgi:hypothetical protein